MPRAPSLTPPPADPRETPSADAERDLRRARRELAMERLAAQQSAQALAHADQTIAALKVSTSWRVSAPIRWARLGLGVLRGRRPSAPTSRRAPPSEAQLAARRVYEAPVGAPAAALFGRRVLIVAELSLAQCAKYRVWQKQQLLESLGVECTVLSWREHEAVRTALQTVSAAIFYRAPGFPDVLDNIAEARRLGVTTLWEVDDLIFDQAAYRSNHNLDRLPSEQRREVLEGVPLYRAAMLACEYGLASTPLIAAEMRAAGLPEAFVIENGLDEQTLEIAAEVLARRAALPRPAGGVTILYGSGTKTHDVDFEAAAPALDQVMETHPDLRLRIVGSLTLPAAFDRFGPRVERIPGVDYESYLRLLGEADISIAPLEAVVFNDAKSNIKFLEAAVLELPSICSPRAAFTSAVRHGENGFLAETTAAWIDALERLIADPALRISVGKAAAQTAHALYGPAALARTQVAPLVDRLTPQAPRTRTRVLTANVYFAPQSFGGATIVAEAMAVRLNARPDMEVAAFTTWPDDEAADYALKRYAAEGLPVLAVRLPERPEQAYVNPRMAELFAGVLRALRPDVVHFHSIQELSGSMVEACLAENVPYVVTLHDSWWICERQFMVRGDGRYCHQTRIDWGVCASCVDNLGASIRRYEWLGGLLAGAAKILTPSIFHRDLHLANGADPARITVNKNGVATAGESARAPLDPAMVRLGFVGGAHPVKGVQVLRRALSGLAESNYELKLVDNTLAVGLSSVDRQDWRIGGKLTVVPPYDRQGLDAFFAGIDVLLFPSQWKESFGLTVREALLRDVWVIVTDAGGAAEDIIDGENGTIIPLGEDEGPLREAIAALLRAPERLVGYRNPYKDQITRFDDQADELAELLKAAARR